MMNLNDSFYLKILLLAVIVLSSSYCVAQKHDYNFINRSTATGSGAFIEYSDLTQDINIGTFEWSGTVSGSPILSDSHGSFLGYFNCRNLYDSIGRIALNGEDMAVGYFQNFIFSMLPEDEGLGNGSNSAFIPINDSLFYLFYKSSEIWIGAPNFQVDFEEQGHRLTSYSDGLYLSKVRLNKNGRLYVNEDEKQIKLVDELFQYKNLMFCKHANGEDWWLLVPKALNSKASVLRIFSNGQIEQAEDIEFSDNFWRARSTSEFSFSPNGEYLARMIVRSVSSLEHIFELFAFNRCEGSVDRILVDSLPVAEVFTSAGAVEFSESGRFIYLAIGSIILQLDLEEPNFFKTRDTVAEWDGYLYFSFLEPLFDAMWRLPNGKILVGSAVSTPFLHYIHKPNLKAEECLFEQRAIMLPDDPLNPPFGVDIEALPKFPPFRMPPSKEPCTTITANINKQPTINLYPNPTKDDFTLLNANGFNIKLIDLKGNEIVSQKVPLEQTNSKISMDHLLPGYYLLLILDANNNIVQSKQLIKL